MKNLILIFAVALFSTQLLSQDITYFFQNLPDSIVGLSIEDRKKIAKNHSEEMVMIGYNSFRFKAVDEKYGYLIGTMAGGVEFKIWEQSNRDKLIAIHISGGGVPNMCIDGICFYHYNGKDFKLLNTKDFFPFEDIEPNFFDDNFEENIKKTHEELAYPFCITTVISQEELNIYVNLNLSEDRSKYEKYGLIGDTMELIWNDGKFTKGKVYWSEKE